MCPFMERQKDDSNDMTMITTVTLLEGVGTHGILNLQKSTKQTYGTYLYCIVLALVLGIAAAKQTACYTGTHIAAQSIMPRHAASIIESTLLCPTLDFPRITGTASRV